LYLRIDVLGGALVCLLALIVWLQSAGLEVGTLSYFGPGFMPQILAVALMGCGLALLVRGLVERNEAAERLVLAVRGPAAVGLAILLFALTIRGFPIGPVRVPQLGLLVAGPLTVFIAGMGSVDARPRELAVLGIALTAMAVLLFTDLLGMPVPVFPEKVADILLRTWGPDWPRRVAVLCYAAIAYGLWRLFGLSFGSIADPSPGTRAR
jgi:hypothetical protein